MEIEDPQSYVPQAFAQAAVEQAAVGQAAAAVGADGAFAAVAAAAVGVGGTVVHAADAAGFDEHPAADGTEPAVADDTGPETAAAGVLAAGTAAAVGLAAGIAAVALAVDAVAHSDIFVCAPVLVAVAVPPALPSLASPSLSEIILTFQL